MAIRWRKNGTLVCAAKTTEEEGDTYIDDRLHYELSVQQKVLVPHDSEETTGLWRWLHGECLISEHPDDCRRSTFIQAR